MSMDAHYTFESLEELGDLLGLPDPGDDPASPVLARRLVELMHASRLRPACGVLRVWAEGGRIHVWVGAHLASAPQVAGAYEAGVCTFGPVGQ